MNRQLLAAGILVLVTATGLVAVSQTGRIDLSGEGTVAVVQLKGPITSTQATGFGATQGITPGQVREVHEEVEKSKYDAVIYEINSGGGAVVASKDVKREFEKLDKPQVCRFQDVSASGGYLISLGCDRIVADSASLTGSIGVRSSYFQYSGLLDKLGVKYVNISSGEYKEIGSPYDNLTDEERRILQSKADRIHREFIGMVQEERDLTPTQVEEIRTGEPFLGERARDLGLVDELGGRESAVAEAESLTDKNLSVEEIETGPSFSLLSVFGAELGLPGAGVSSPLRAVY